MLVTYITLNNYPPGKKTRTPLVTAANFLWFMHFYIEYIKEIFQTMQTFLQFRSGLCIIKCLFSWRLAFRYTGLTYDVFCFNKAPFHTNRTDLWSFFNETNKPYVIKPHKIPTFSFPLLRNTCLYVRFCKIYVHCTTSLGSIYYCFPIHCPLPCLSVSSCCGDDKPTVAVSPWNM